MGLQFSCTTRLNSSLDVEYVEDRIPAWPPDISAILYGRISNPEWDAKVPWQDASGMAARFNIRPAFAFGHKDPLESSAKLTEVYKCLADKTVTQSQKRAENAVYFMVTSGIGPEFLDRLPLGLASPLREAIRTCQLMPPVHWPPSVYRAIGREDVAASAVHDPDILAKDGYRPTKDFIVRLNETILILRVLISESEKRRTTSNNEPNYC